MTPPISWGIDEPGIVISGLECHYSQPGLQGQMDLDMYNRKRTSYKLKIYKASCNDSAVPSKGVKILVDQVSEEMFSFCSLLASAL